MPGVARARRHQGLARRPSRLTRNNIAGLGTGARSRRPFHDAFKDFRESAISIFRPRGDFTGHVKSDTVVYQTAFAFKGGIILTRGHSVGAAPAKFAGRVIGGTGAYRGATGTAHGVAITNEDTRFTIRYRL